MKKFSLFYLVFSLSLMSVYAGTPTVKESILFVIGLIIVWFFVSFCIYLAHSMISSKKVHYGDSLRASLIGFIAVSATFLIFKHVLDMPYVGIIVAIFVWFAVIMSVLDLDFGQSIAVSIVTVIAYVMLIVIFAWLFDIPIGP